MAGNVISSTDAAVHTTAFSYDDNFSSTTTLAGASAFAFVTQKANAAGHVTRARYDYYLGKPTDVWDANNVQTTITYAASEPLDRPTQVTRAVGTTAQTQTSFSYCDAGCNSVTTRSDRDNAGDGLIQTKVLYDGLGRQIETQALESSGYISRKQTYDGLGRESAVTAPDGSSNQLVRTGICNGCD